MQRGDAIIYQKCHGGSAELGQLREAQVTKGLSSVLNASRWCAAFIVLIHHVRHIVLADLVNVENKSLPTKCFYFLTGLGHEAVMVFFVVSGLLVGALTLEKWRTGVAAGKSILNDFPDYP